VTNMDICTSCGICIDRCLFKARRWNGHTLRYIRDACYGCGLCVTTCPVNATVMERREKKSTPSYSAR
jgi:NAD-dependent dihydropyrimidine dehydrogenase PreA subunit